MSDPTANAKITIGVVGDARCASAVDPSEIAGGMKTYFPQYEWSLVPAPAAGPRQSGFSKTEAYRAILSTARAEGTSHCLMIDAAQAGLKGSWLDSLIRPGIHSKYDLVTPVYSGGAHDHLLSRTLLHPLLHSLFGQGVRQPLASEFLLSANLIDRLLSRHDWDSPAARDAPELWINFVAGMEGYRIAESFVGCDDRRPGGPRPGLQRGVEQMMSSLFLLMERYEGSWAIPPSVRRQDQFGKAAVEASRSPKPDGLAYLVRFVQAFPALEGEWRHILAGHTFEEIARLYQQLRRGETGRGLGDAAWVRVVYEVAGAWRQRVLPRGQVLGLFAPLYMAHTGSVLMNHRWNEQAEVEGETRRLAGYFQALHPAMLRLWGSRAAMQRDAA